MLAITTLVAIALSYAQWQRQCFLSELRDLERFGVTLTWEPSWSDAFWPPASSTARLFYKETGGKEFRLGSETFADNAELDSTFKEIHRRLRSLGVEQTLLVVEDVNGVITATQVYKRPKH